VSGGPQPAASPGAPRPHALLNGQKQSLDLCGLSPDGRQPSPLTSPLLYDAGCVRTDDEDEVRRKVGGGGPSDQTAGSAAKV
jgi:hypothetical protein